jgi:Flp pilus assembly protein TadB
VTALAALWGAGVGLGLVAIIAGLRGAPPPRLPRWLRPGPRGAIGRLDRGMLRIGLAVGAGVLVGAVTRWPVGALLAAGAGALLPDLAGGQAAQQAAVARAEAMAAWAEMLRDTLAGAAGLEQAIVATAPVAPAPIRSQVLELAARLERPGARLVPALHAFADELGDPTADLVVAALVLASQRQARRLGELLGALARAARDDATMRLRVEAGRARTRTSVRVVVGMTLAMAAGLVVLNRGYLAPYDSALGQLILAGVGGLFGVAFWWLARMARVETPQRLLGGDLEDNAEGVAR